MTNHHSMNASIPLHSYGFVCQEILYGLDPEKKGQFEPCAIFGITSVPARSLMFSIMCESGAMWSRIPIHMLRWQKPAGSYPIHLLSDLQCWDSMGWDFSVTLYEYLREMACQYRKPDGSMVPARYWFTLDHTMNGYSQYPSQHKCNHVLMLEDGSCQLAASPNNRILWADKSFVRAGHKLDYRVMNPTTWHGENDSVHPQATAITQDAI